MPIYLYQCDMCKGTIEKVQPINGEAPACCGLPTTKLPTTIAMFKMKGMGGYPSLRKAHQAGRRNLVEDAEKVKQWV